VGEAGCTSAPPWPYQLRACLLTCGRLERWSIGASRGEVGCRREGRREGGQRALRKRWLRGPPTQLGARYSP
jgi:hypothetical protein